MFIMFLESGYYLSLNNAVYVLSITSNLFISKLANVSYILRFGYNDIKTSFNSHIFGYGCLEGYLYKIILQQPFYGIFNIV